MKLHIIQNEIKAPKGQFNAFGKYKYRSCEDIVEAAKPVLLKHEFALTITDEVVLMGNRFYIKATATINNGIETHSAVAFAREEETKKGMDASQITGAASSYARKYALNGLFAIDDTKDADAINDHSEIKEPLPLISKAQFDKLLQRLGDGEKDAGEKALKAFSFNAEQLSILTEKLN